MSVLASTGTLGDELPAHVAANDPTFPMKTLMICLFRGLRIDVFPDHLEMEGRAHELTREDVEKLVALLVRVAPPRREAGTRPSGRCRTLAMTRAVHTRG